MIIRKLVELKEQKMLERFNASGILRSFHYDVGSLREGQKSYTLTEEEEGIHLIYQVTSFEDGGEVRGDYLVSPQVMQQLKSVLRNEKIYLWNGFDKSNSVMAGAVSFSMTGTFDRYTLRAYGMGMTPGHFADSSEILLNFLEGVVKANLENAIK